LRRFLKTCSERTFMDISFIWAIDP
jgi:hypothetical protein